MIFSKKFKIYAIYKLSLLNVQSKTIFVLTLCQLFILAYGFMPTSYDSYT